LKTNRIAILGAGNIGTAIANGLVESGRFDVADITLTRRKVTKLDGMKKKGFVIQTNNCEAVKEADVIIIAVEPLQVDGLLEEVASYLEPDRHIIISVVTGMSRATILRRIGAEVPVVRAMPNTAISVRESMTCLASDDAGDAVDVARSIFDTVGTTLLLDEEQMVAATAVGACGIAFFLRAIRAASQGGIEVGLHSGDALALAAQTARGAATLLVDLGYHPEGEIDKVTTPRGCTIAGLNQMEHDGFSSAMIRGIAVSAERAAKLYSDNEKDE